MTRAETIALLETSLDNLLDVESDGDYTDKGHIVRALVAAQDELRFAIKELKKE